MKMTNTKIPFQVILVILGTPLFFYFDSVSFNTLFPYGQWISNFLMLFVYTWFYWVGNQKIRLMLLIMAVVSAFFEILASLVMTWYSYRLGTIPLYIPLGHAIVFTTIYYLHKQPFLRINTYWLELLFYIFIILICTGSLYFLHDTCGLICFLVFLALIRYRQNKLFYLIMFFMVLYLEVIGTNFQSWAWYSVIGNHLDYVHTANPPSGVAGLYMVIDLSISYCYLYVKKLKRYYSRTSQSPYSTSLKLILRILARQSILYLW